MRKANSRTSFTKNVSKKKSAIIILVILAITVGHFLTQMSFIESENKRLIESLVKTEPVIQQNTQTETKVDEQIAENKSEDMEVQKTDVVLPSKPLKSQRNINAEKIAQRELKRHSEPAHRQNPLKKEIKNESKSDRLRRAEKILTGF